ncbi:MAG: bifunctional oligoribonuclease/PAP phosphatase NrnA [Actinomycetota bacterium]|nr:bifunctional oligoribonuclease/PAP phosphatase NrnA [Actinomycetota bacterium]
MSLDEEEVSKASRLIKDAKSAAIFTHEFPDGDAIGSALGLGLMLEGAGKKVSLSWPEPLRIPEKYNFLHGRHLLVSPNGVAGTDVVITVDCANLGRLSKLEPIATDSPKIVNIDHHIDNTLFGFFNLVDPAASATAEIIFSNHKSLGLEVSRESAVCLYCAIATDTGRFSYSNVSATTLRIAAELVDLGVSPNEVYENVYQNNSLEYLKLMGIMLNHASVDYERELVFSWISQEDLAASRVQMDETEELIDSLRSVRGSRIIALFKEKEDGTIRVSLRSKKGEDVGRVARALGGGGHPAASGYTSSKATFPEALAELKDEIERIWKES